MPAVVLCIDKRQPNLTTERQVLEVAGYQVLAAVDCEQASELLKKHLVDIVLLSDDLSSDEQETCAQLRRLQPSVPIILQRASFHDSSLPAEADVVVPKATHPREKLRIIESLLLPHAA